jgi:hypothetical protein
MGHRLEEAIAAATVVEGFDLELVHRACRRGGERSRYYIGRAEYSLERAGAPRAGFIAA